MGESISEQNEYERMSFDDLAQDSRYSPVLEQQALLFLRAQNNLYETRYKDELDPNGYLVRKEGDAPTTKPSMAVNTSQDAQRVLEMTLEALRNQSP